MREYFRKLMVWLPLWAKKLRAWLGRVAKELAKLLMKLLMHSLISAAVHVLMLPYADDLRKFIWQLLGR